MTVAKRFAALGICLMIAVAAAGSVRAEDYYRGKKINFVVGSAIGGGYDTYTRLLARHLGKHIAGNPSVIVQNMPGAGSIRAANFLFQAAPKDGTTIGMIDQATYLNQLLGSPGLKVDAVKFGWIGRIVDNSAVLFASQKAAVKRIEDAKTKKLIVATPGTSSQLNWTVLKEVVGLKFELVTGYRGTHNALLAMLRGEVEGLSMPWSLLKVRLAKMLKNKEINLLLQTGIEKHKDIPQVPRMIDLVQNANDQALLALFSTSSTFGRSVLAPPGLPAERLTALRQAFNDTIKDPGFLGDAKRLKLDVEPLSGQELQNQIEKISQFPPVVIERARKIARTRN